ncbi:ABC transporter substrate-binding protein [Paenibacillus albidus]|uniref:ABC transporter substrate-binding protein n=1 Tax=Paenibacillus albidus TaxID=2041023 RepID=A0A917FJU5_9BACL|nr:ABC transporter substrate-binding protein [Paenibacillus albidus]GGF84376.1 ABC transporter substrate-binding protein [Paenibacillus albidus]
MKNVFRNIPILPALLLAVMLMLSACGNQGEAERTADTPAGAGTEAPHKLTIMLDWYPNAVHSFLYAAEKNGYFAEEGLEVEIQMPSDSNDALKLVAADKIDLALTYQPQVLMARGENIPVVSIGAIVRHPLNHLMVAEGSGIQSPKDLAGKAVGYSSIPLYEAMLRTMVTSDGGDANSVKLIDVGFDLVPAISTGQVEGIMGGFINHEQLILEQEGHPVTSLNPTDYGVPDYYELVLATSDQGLLKSEADFRKFLKAAAKGQQYVAEHPEDALALLLEHENETSPLDKNIEQKSLQILLPLMDAGDQPFGYQSPESWDKVHQWLTDNNLLSNEVKTQAAYANLAGDRSESNNLEE